MPSLWRPLGLPVCLAFFSFMQAAPGFPSGCFTGPLCLSLPPCTRASSLTPRTLDERPGFPLSQEIGFISPAHLAAPKGHTRNEAQPRRDTAPCASPMSAHVTPVIYSAPTWCQALYPRAPGLSSSPTSKTGILVLIFTIKKCVHMPEVTPAPVLRPGLTIVAHQLC